jgi:hypothetical protein
MSGEPPPIAASLSAASAGAGAPTLPSTEASTSAAASEPEKRVVKPRVASSAPIRLHVLKPLKAEGTGAGAASSATGGDSCPPPASNGSADADAAAALVVPECGCGRQHVVYGQTYLYCTCGRSKKQASLVNADGGKKKKEEEEGQSTPPAPGSHPLFISHRSALRISFPAVALAALLRRIARGHALRAHTLQS